MESVKVFSIVYNGRKVGEQVGHSIYHAKELFFSKKSIYDPKMKKQFVFKLKKFGSL